MNPLVNIHVTELTRIIVSEQRDNRGGPSTVLQFGNVRIHLNNPALSMFFDELDKLPSVERVRKDGPP